MTLASIRSIWAERAVSLFVITEVPMKEGEAPWFLMWCGPVLVTFGLIWAWLIDIVLAQTITVLDMSMRSALLVAAGAIGTILSQSAVLWTWRRYVRAIEEALTIEATHPDAGRDESKNRAGNTVPSAASHLSGEARRPGPSSP